jgi:atypical dual specificity phosphatase
MNDTISHNLWSFLPGKFCGVRKPVHADEVEELIRLHRIGGIISLLDDEENLELYNQCNIPFLHFATKGGTSPSIEQVKAAISFQESMQGMIAVHCTSGKRRTGTLLGGIFLMLVKQGKITIDGDNTAFDAMKSTLLNSKPDCDLREAQWQWLQEVDGTQIV